MHPRISIDDLCFPGASLESNLLSFRTLEARRIGIVAPKLAAAGLDQGIKTLARSEFVVATLVQPFMSRYGLADKSHWSEGRAELSRTIEAAHALKAESIYMLSGGRGQLSWEDAADAFCEAIAPCAAEAKAACIPLLIEPAPALYCDLSITHTLRDTVKLAEQADIGVCIDIFACWTEAELRETILRAAPRCGLVQVSDYVMGDRSIPCRAVPGDGHIPLERILGWILDTGYKGAFDLELLGPRIDAEGHIEAVRRSAAWLDKFLKLES
jgi:sugar phosphate isomerase/epimerase